MVRSFYNWIANVYRFSSVQIRWSLVEQKNLIYENIKVSFYQLWQNVRNSALAVQTWTHTHEVNLYPEYDVKIWDIIEINWETYKVNDVLHHYTHTGVLDNIQGLISKTTTENV
jgi:muramoyltetrapeptide carboxypeptidase LdcA involved in peptidoglycan recycling